MDADTITEETVTDTTSQTEPQPETEPETEPAGPRLLRRPFHGRMLAGVAEGIADYLDADPTLVRIGFAVLTLFGGAGVAIYLAGLLLIPDEDSDQSIASTLISSIQSR